MTLTLLRMFGIPIDVKFEGIHSGTEMADLKYYDRIHGSEAHVGIHVKSRDRRTKRLGRGNSRIQSLYAQYCYSLYQIARGKWTFNILGIAVPQEIDGPTFGSFAYLAKRTGIPLLAILRPDWLRIAGAAVEATRLRFGST